jgi:hypothetical protein
MKRKDIYLSEVQIKLLAKEAKVLGISLSELIRRILDWYIESEVKK